MTPRIDPHLPLVWRSSTELQIGGAVARVVLAPDDVELQLVHLLRHGANRSTLRTVATGLGADELASDRLLARLAPVLAAEEQPRPVAVEGHGPVADRIIATVDDRRVRLVEAGDPEAELVILVGDWMPSAAAAADYQRRDLAHLPVVADDAGIVIGPVVEPGRTPCLSCHTLARRDADPAWPAVAIQLMRRPAVVPELVAAEAVVRALRLAGLHLDGRPTPATATRIGADGSISELARPFHPACGCRLPGGSATAPDHRATAGSGAPN